MSGVTHAVLIQRRARAPTRSLLPSWADTESARERARPTPTVAAILRDLVSWGCDIAIVVTGSCPEDRSAIERVRSYAHAWLTGDPCPEVEMDDVLTTVAAAMAGIDREVGGTDSEQDEAPIGGSSSAR